MRIIFFIVSARVLGQAWAPGSVLVSALEWALVLALEWVLVSDWAQAQVTAMVIRLDSAPVTVIPMAQE